MSKYRLIFFIKLFLICTVNVYFIAVSPDVTVIAYSFPEGIKLQSINGQNLELKANDFISTSAGLKVETVAISSPVSFDSIDNHLSNPNHLVKLYLKKKYSLISHSDLIISKTLNLSPLITRLQI